MPKLIMTPTSHELVLAHFTTEEQRAIYPDGSKLRPDGKIEYDVPDWLMADIEALMAPGEAFEDFLSRAIAITRGQVC